MGKTANLFDITEPMEEAPEEAKTPEIVERPMVGALMLPSVTDIKAGIAQFDAELVMVKGKVDAATVNSQDELDALVDTRKTAKDVIKAIENAVAAKVGNIKKLIQDVNAITKHYRDTTDAIIKVADTKIQAWQRAEFIREQEEQRKQQKAIDDENERLAKLAEKKGVEAPAPLPPVAPVAEVKKTVSTASGAKATQVDHWVYLEDKADIRALAEAALKDKTLLKYLAVNGRAVNDAIRQGVRVIPGLVIENQPYLR